MHDGFKYTLNRRGREGQYYWRCADRMCPGRVITSENDELLFTTEHNHEGNEVEVEVAKVVCAMKEREQLLYRDFIKKPFEL